MYTEAWYKFIYAKGIPMTFLQKISLGHQAFKRGISLVWHNKTSLFYGVAFLAASVISIFCYIDRSVGLIKQSIGAVGLLTFFGANLFVFLIYASLYHFLLSRIQGNGISFWQSFIFDRKRMRLIFIMARVYAFFSALSLFLKFYLLTVLWIIVSLLVWILGFILFFALIIVVDHAPGFWLSIKEGVRFLWSNMLALVTICFELMMWVIFLVCYVVAATWFIRILFHEFLGEFVLRCSGGSTELFSFMITHVGALLLSFFLGLLFFVAVLFMSVGVVAVYVCLYKATVKAKS